MPLHPEYRRLLEERLKQLKADILMIEAKLAQDDIERSVKSEVSE
jgi:hypothetical protein